MNLNTKIHLCDACLHRSEYPTCTDDLTVDSIEFGNGQEFDNIIGCPNYEKS